MVLNLGHWSRFSTFLIIFLRVRSHSFKDDYFKTWVDLCCYSAQRISLLKNIFFLLLLASRLRPEVISLLMVHDLHYHRKHRFEDIGGWHRKSPCAFFQEVCGRSHRIYIEKKMTKYKHGLKKIIRPKCSLSLSQTSHDTRPRSAIKATVTNVHRRLVKSRLQRIRAKPSLKFRARTSLQGLRLR